MFKPEFPNPNARSVANALKAAGYDGVQDVRIGKEFRIELEVESKEKAHQVVEEMCQQLLAHRVTDNYEFTIDFPEPEPEAKPVLSEVELDEIEIKFPMGEKLIILGESKDLTDIDCLFLCCLFMRYQKSGKFQEWLNRETRADVIERADKVVKKLFGRANKAVFTDEKGPAFAALFMNEIE